VVPYVLDLMRTRISNVGLGLVAALSPMPAACSSTPEPPRLEQVATSDRQWTGIAVSAEERVFVNFPRWSEDVPVSVGELIDGNVVPYPNAELQSWKPGDDPAGLFVCVQSVVVDARDRLWILDPGNPGFAGVVEGAPKLMQVDLATDRIVRTYRFGPETALPGSYLNDVRIDVAHDVAYLTDSGDGALLVLDLRSGEARRLLDDHPSTQSEGVTLTIGGRPWLLGGSPPDVHADGIAFDPSSDTVFFQALTGRTMYRIAASVLRDADRGDDDVAAAVEVVGRTGASDGLVFGPSGFVYVSALEEDAIVRVAPDGDREIVVQNPAIAWPDSFAVGPDGAIWFTTARIHEGASPTAPYGVFRLFDDVPSR
jgi:sugar lactone lactonase YvrE